MTVQILCRQENCRWRIVSGESKDAEKIAYDIGGAVGGELRRLELVCHRFVTDHWQDLARQTPVINQVGTIIQRPTKNARLVGV